MSTERAMRVPPYTLTQGRTESSVKLAIETMVRTTGSGRVEREKRRILDLCIQPTSVAEISAMLSIPLQVAKILVGDLVAQKYLSRTSVSTQDESRPDLALLERVLDGLQSL